jgi:hypothetical protein
MKKFFRLWKVIILDTLGVLLMILAVLTGWLPGPGGIPLFIAGLALLAINHTWAQAKLDWVKAHSKDLFTRIKRKFKH